MLAEAQAKKNRVNPEHEEKMEKLGHWIKSALWDFVLSY